jgi:hypothetical protein
MSGNAVPSLLQHLCRLAAAAPSEEQLLADFLVPAARAGEGGPATDPLPSRGAVRLGTARYRYGVLTDGRSLYSLSDEGGLNAEGVGLSPDGMTLAVKDHRFLTFPDAATGKEPRKVKYLPEAGGRRSNDSRPESLPRRTRIRPA